jgi:hypothetical protein
VVLMDREPLALVCAALSAAASGIPLEAAEGGNPHSSPGSSGNSSGSGSSRSGDDGGAQSTASLAPPQQQGAAMHPVSRDAEAGGSGGSSGSGVQGSDAVQKPSLLAAWPGSVSALGRAAATVLQHMQQRGVTPPSGR